MSRFDWSLNSVIKILVIICLVTHLVVLQNTTRNILYDNASQLDLPSGIPEVIIPSITTSINQNSRREQVLTDVFQEIDSNSSEYRQRQPNETSFDIVSGRTINISSYVDSERPVTAFDLMKHFPKISLEDLIHTDPNPICKKGRAQKSLFESSTDLDSSITHPAGRKIPKIIHVTTKTRCMPPVLHENLERWRLPGHNLYVHDDAAVERLLFETHWPEFPHLNLLRPCMISGAAMADLWRYVPKKRKGFRNTLSLGIVFLNGCPFCLAGI
jgi:hypothetical protein